MENSTPRVDILCKCQIIEHGTELYKVLDLLDVHETEVLKEAMNSRGYDFAYNMLEDCFVVF